MSESNPVRPEMGLDEIIEAFEEAQARDGRAELSEFLPGATHPDFLKILCELVRVDMEYRWRRGRPIRLADYEGRYPELFRDPARAREVAFEEYRLRHQAGDAPSPSEYRQRFGGEAADWPLPRIATEDFAAKSEVRSRTAMLPSSCQGSSDALALVRESPETTREQVEMVEDLSRVNGAAAGRLARGLVAMPHVGDRFLGFQLRKELGRGAFGRVFLADQEHMAGRPVALKVTADALGETQALAQLQHTNIVPIYSVHRDGPLQALCMPYFGSATLADVIAGLDGGKKLPDSGRGLLSTLDERRESERSSQPSNGSNSSATDSADGASIAEAGTVGAPSGAVSAAQIEHLRRSNYVDAILWLGLRLADGLAHAHERGILHRDLKPANVLFTDDGEPMLLDFNLATDLKLSVRGSAAMVGGTLPYMAVEHLEAFIGKPRTIDARSDIFSLGVILYELLTGRHPYEARRGRAEAILLPMIEDRRGPVPDVRSKNRAVSPAVEAIVRRCLDPDPARRYQEARHLAEDLQRQVDHRPLRHTREPSVRERMRKWASRHPRLTSTTTVAAAALVLVVSLAGGVLARQHRIDRLEARESFRKLRSEVDTAEFLLSSRSGPPREIDEGLLVCQAAVGRYGVEDDPHWMSRSRVALLQGDDRVLISQNIGELLGLWAQGETWRAETAVDGEKAERIARAKKLLDRAEAIFGANAVPAALTLVRSDLARIDGRLKEAQRLREAAEATPLRSAGERLLLAGDRLDKGRYREALALAEEAARVDPRDALVWGLRGHCLVRLSRPAQAVESYDIAISLAPGFAWWYFERGAAALDVQNYKRAIEDFDRVLADRPDLLEARVNRALARLGSGDAAGALADLDVILLQPEAPTRMYFVRAIAHDALGHPDQAARDRQKGKTRTPTDERSWITRGFNRVSESPADAIRDFESALKLNPRSFDALNNKASVLSENLGRVEDAIKTLDRAIAYYPESVPALAGRGVLLARLGRREAALEDARACLTLNAGADTPPRVSADTLYRVACMYALTSRKAADDYKPALGLLMRAIVLDPSWLPQVPNDRDLDPLRDRREFRKLMEALAEPCA